MATLSFRDYLPADLDVDNYLIYNVFPLMVEAGEDSFEDTFILHNEADLDLYLTFEESYTTSKVFADAAPAIARAVVMLSGIPSMNHRYIAVGDNRSVKYAVSRPNTGKHTAEYADSLF